MPAWSEEPAGASRYQSKRLRSKYEDTEVHENSSFLKTWDCGPGEPKRWTLWWEIFVLQLRLRGTAIRTTEYCGVISRRGALAELRFGRQYAAARVQRRLDGAWGCDYEISWSLLQGKRAFNLYMVFNHGRRDKFLRELRCMISCGVQWFIVMMIIRTTVFWQEIIAWIIFAFLEDWIFLKVLYLMNFD